MRKILISLLAVCMIFSMLSVTSFAASSPVEVDGVGYDSLSAAVGALKKDGTLQNVTLNSDVTVSGQIAFAAGTNVVFDLGGHTLTTTYNSAFPFSLKGTIEIKNGTVVDNISRNSYTITVNGKTMLKDIVINSAATVGAIQAQNNAEGILTVYNGVKINSAYNTIYAYDTPTVTIYGGEFISTASDGRVMKFTGGSAGKKTIYGGKFINNNATSATNLDSFFSGSGYASFYGGTYSATKTQLSVSSSELEKVTNSDGTYSIAPKANAAMFVNEKFGTENVWDVIQAMSDAGDTVKLKANSTFAKQFVISKSIIIDLDGHTLTSTYTTTTANTPSTIVVKGNANATILNGRVENTADTTTPNFGMGVGMSYSANKTDDTSSLTLGGDGNSFEFSSSCKTNAITVYSPNATLTVNDGVVITAANSSAANAIYTYGKLIINGGRFLNNNPAKNSIKAVSSSAVEINGGYFPYFVVCQTGNMEVNGGTFDALFDKDKMESTDNPKINGGTFKLIPKNIASGKYAVENAEGKYDISSAYAASIGKNYYATLELAIEKAEENATVDLNANNESVTVSKVVTISKNGYSAAVTAGDGYVVSETDSAYVVSVKPDEDPLVTLLSNIKLRAFTAENNTGVVRFVAPIDSLEYKMVGFIIVNEDNSATIDTQYDWQSKSKIVYTDITVDTEKFVPSDFGANANYIFTTAIGNIPTTEPLKLSLKAFAIKTDGTIVFGNLVSPVK